MTNQVNKLIALLVGIGLTAAARMKPPTVGLGTETGGKVAKLAPLYRTAGGSMWLRKACSEGQSHWFGIG